MEPHSFGARAPVIQGFFNGGRPPLTLQAHAGHGGRPGGRGHPPVAQPFGSGSAFQVPSTVRFAGRGSGQPLPAAVLQRMEEFFGTSFADVRVHVGPQAASIGAVAFTMGADLYFAPGQYDPHSAHGQRLLGHELAHVVQQRAGRVRNPLGGGVAVVQDPALEAEAERMGTRLRAMPSGAAVQARMSGAQATASLAARPSDGRGGAAQRYLVRPPVQGPNGRMRIRATLPGSAGEAGSVNIRPTRSGLLEISDLYVAPEHRRRGLGTKLMHATLAAARTQGAVLEARPSDAGISGRALQAMYERLGFRTSGLSARGAPIMRFGAGAVQAKATGHVPRVVQRAATSSLYGPSQTKANPTDQLGLEYAIHQLQPIIMAKYHDVVIEELKRIHNAYIGGKIIRSDYLEQLKNSLEKLSGYLMNQNPILKEAWDDAVTQTRSGKYSDVGSKFGAKLRKFLAELKHKDPRWETEIDNIATQYVNKHHLLLKSIYAAKQIEGANLMHVGIGTASSSNTPLHKMMHEFTSGSTTGSANYSKMEPNVARMLEDFVAYYEDYPFKYADE